MEEWRRRDPILIFKEKLIRTFNFSEEELRRIEEKAKKEVEEAFREAEAAPYPEPAEAYLDVFVEPIY
jgi:TPP-dependent pyruvate/acetoin dehydrogenase alpha subunit